MTAMRFNDCSQAGYRAEYLSAEQCDRLHSYSLEILRRTGVRLFHPEAGAVVSEGNRVRIPASLVEKAFTTVPRQVKLYNRHGRPAIFAEGYRCFYDTGSDCLHIVDHRTGMVRDPVLNDIIEGMTVCDALSHIDFVMLMFVPVDVDPLVSDRYQMEAMLSSTTKPIIFVTNEFSGAADAVEMAEIVAGGAESLRQRPNIACYINVTTGLRHNEEALQKLLFLSEKGLPGMCIPVVVGGTTGPVTQPGSVALVYAGVLAGLVLSQLTREGAPYIFPGWGGAPIDMRTLTSPYCTPNWGSIASSLAHFYRMPSFGLGGGQRFQGCRSASRGGSRLHIAGRNNGRTQYYSRSGLS